MNTTTTEQWPEEESFQIIEPVEWALLFMMVHEIEGLRMTPTGAIDAFNRLHDTRFRVHS